MKPGSKESRTAIARGRIEFWTIWGAEMVTSVARDYCLSRKNHWEHVIKAIELEP